MGTYIYRMSLQIPIKHKTKGTHTMLIDEDDYDKIKELNLTLNDRSNPHTFYAKHRVNKLEKILDEPEVLTNGKTRIKVYKYEKTIHIHRLIMGLDDYKKDKRIVNHINGNGLDNRKENLEISNALHNSQSCNCPNKPKGVIYYDNSGKRKKRWRFCITVNKKRHSKRFETKEEAEDYRANYKYTQQSIQKVKPIK